MSVKGSVVGDVLLMCHPSQAVCWALRLVVDLSAFFFPPLYINAEEYEEEGNKTLGT